VKATDDLKTFALRFTPAQHRALKQHALDKGKSMQDVIIQGLRRVGAIPKADAEKAGE
jgi:predicted HicB family RNase H-like nuclease